MYPILVESHSGILPTCSINLSPYGVYKVDHHCLGKQGLDFDMRNDINLDFNQLSKENHKMEMIFIETEGVLLLN